MGQPSKLYYLVGPSGAGKDTLLRHFKKNQYADNQPIVAHRYITRPVRENDENHVELSEFDFNRRKKSELFLFDWQSHGNQYAIGKEVKKWVKAGQNVIINGSRLYLNSAREIYPKMVPVWLSVSEEILRQRLLDRGRETSKEIENRIHRNRKLEKLKLNNCTYINNDQSIEDTIGQIIALIGINSI